MENTPIKPLYIGVATNSKGNLYTVMNSDVCPESLKRMQHGADCIVDAVKRRIWEFYVDGGQVKIKTIWIGDADA